MSCSFKTDWREIVVNAWLIIVSSNMRAKSSSVVQRYTKQQRLLRKSLTFWAGFSTFCGLLKCTPCVTRAKWKVQSHFIVLIISTVILLPAFLPPFLLSKTFFNKDITYNIGSIFIILKAGLSVWLILTYRYWLSCTTWQTLLYMGVCCMLFCSLKSIFKYGHASDSQITRKKQLWMSLDEAWKPICHNLKMDIYCFRLLIYEL